MPESRLDILLRSRDRASRDIQQVDRNVGRLGRGAGLAQRAVAGLAAGLTVAGVVSFARATFELGQLGAETRSLRTAFERMAESAGNNADDMLSALRTASRGAIADYDLMLAANRAMTLGVASNTEELTGLMEVARARGQAMGLSMEQAFGDIVTGLGRASPMILDNLGIVIDAEAAYQRHADAIGRDVGELSKQEQIQALVNDVLRDSQGLLDGSADSAANQAEQVQNLASAWENLRRAIGENVSGDVSAASGNLARALNAAADALTADRENKLQEQIADVSAEIQEVHRQASELEDFGEFGIFDPEALESGGGRVENLMRKYRELTATLSETQGTDTAIAGLDSFDQAMLEAAGTTGELRMATQSYDRAMLTAAGITMDAGNTAAISADQWQQLADELDEAGGAAAGAGARIASAANQIAVSLAGIQGFGAALDLASGLSTDILSEANVIMFETNATLQERDEVIIPALIQRHRRLASEQVQAARQTTSAVSEVNQEFERLKSTVEGVLSGALNLGDIGAGGIIEDALGREDAINEDARRLADVAVRGFESPWAEYFRTQFPALWAEAFSGTTGGGDVRAQAAELLRQFQSGLRPELIDREAAKERIKAMITGEQNMAALAQELATEIAAEMDISTAQALQAAQGALGGGDQMGVGQGMGEGFGQGAVQGVGNAGTQMVATLKAQLTLESNLELVREAGQTNGQIFANSFIEFFGGSVPAAVVGILADLVTPVVEDNIDTNATLTGPQG